MGIRLDSNHDRLRRTRDGRYEVGVYIEKDIYARFVAQVLVPYNEDPVPHLAKTIGPMLAYDDVAKAAHAWALEHIPAIYKFGQEDLVITLLKVPEFGQMEIRDE